MFQFPKSLHISSLILILIGVVAVAASFLGGSHADEHGHREHAATHSESAHGHHQADHGDAHAAEHDDSRVSPEAIEKYGDRSYHKASPRTNVTNSDNYFYLTSELDEETLHHQQANAPWANLLFNNFYFLAIALGGLFFLAVQYAAQVGWSVVLLRVMEAMSQFIWIPMAIMMVIVLTGVMHMGGNHLWHWLQVGIMDSSSDHYDALIAGKGGYLNGPFFIIRTIVYFVGWVIAARMMRKMSLKMEEGSVDYAVQWGKLRTLSVVFLAFFAITSSSSAWDWIMSIDTHWYSTLFGWYTFSGLFVSALTAITLITIYLKNKGYLAEVNENHIHDMAKFMFAFSVFWTYLWFAQFMLIWYGNKPEEVTYYMVRFGEYRFVFWAMVVINFIFPLLILMSRGTKRNYGFIITAGIMIIIGHWLDVFIMIHPGTVGAQWSLNWITIGTFLGYLGLFIQVVFRALAKAPLVMKNHPMFLESKQFHI